MNKQPIENATDPDLRFSQRALQRAALRAHELARQTGTMIVIFRNGTVEHVQPDAACTAPELLPTEKNRKQ
jgi:hypothetical protein